MSFWHIILAIFISVLWGLNFVAAKSALGYFPTFFLLAIRLLIVSVILLPFIKKSSLAFDKLLVISVTLTVLHFGFMFLALEKGIDSSVAVIIDQLKAPLAVTLGYFIFSEKVGNISIFGLFIAIVGTFVIVGTPNIINNYGAFGLLVASSTAWAFYNLQVKHLNNLDVVSFIGWVSLLGTPQLFLISYLVEGNQFGLLYDIPLDALFSLLYIAIAATIIAHGSWYYLLKNYSVNLVVPYSLLVPIFGITASIFILGERLTWQIMIGGILTVIGVSIVVIKEANNAIRKGKE